MTSPRRLLAVAVFLVGTASAFAIEIDRFDVSIRLEPDGTLFVTETIVLDFGELEKHGIFRTIPVSYARGDTISTRYALRLRVLGVQNENGEPFRFKIWPEGRDLHIRIGDPDRTVTGTVSYVINYRVQRAINRFESHDELYWNVTGNDWYWPIHQASVNVVFPGQVPGDQLRHETFTGFLGSTKTTATERVGEKEYRAEAKELAATQGLTIVLGFPKGILLPPSALRELVWKVGDNVSFLLVGLVPVLAFAGMLSLYLRHGRDPGDEMPIVVQYEPPEELSPAEVGSLIDESIDIPDIVSTAIDLAVRGYLEIHEEESTQFHFLTTTDYRFEKLKDADDDLKRHETLFLSALFAKGDSVMLSSLRNRFYQSIPTIAAAISRQMLQLGLYVRDPSSVRKLYRKVALLAAAVPVVLGLLLLQSGYVRSLLPPEPLGLVAFAALCLLLTLLVVRLFARVMPSKTPKGARLARHCLGFQEFVSRVEKERLERMAKDDPTLFEKVLPYAVVLGVVDEWAERFEDLLREPPSWFRSSSLTGRAFQPRAFVSRMGNSLHVMGSTFQSRPSSSGGSSWGGRSRSSSAGRGFSGFSRGRGSSGGGFGGGGGRSW